MAENENRSAVSNHPRVLHGQTVFAGTRVPLDVMLAYRQGGHSIRDFLLDFPSVEPWQAQAVWALADGEITQLIRKGDPHRRDRPG